MITVPLRVCYPYAIALQAQTQVRSCISARKGENWVLTS